VVTGKQHTYSILKTKQPAGGPAYKGGASTWAKLEHDLRELLRDSSTTVLTTLLDYYAFPQKAPGMTDRPQGSPYDRVLHVESALEAIRSTCPHADGWLRELEARMSPSVT
jgi:hypothetical protein